MKWLAVLLLTSTFAYGAGSLNRNCGKEGFACGECDSQVQSDFNALIADITGSGPNTDGHWGGDFGGKKKIKPGATLENTLSRIKDIMKKNNPAGQNGLNMIVIGESESLQPTDVRDGKMYPRVAIKSPNSELWVTFSTDPTNAAYQTLEVMRWNGKDAKYEFMELDFNPNHREMDGTGERCLACHKSPNARPNWDTYRAWAGVVPSRDDMLEMHAQNGSTVKGDGAKMGADGRAYLSFLEQVVDAKEKNPNDRLALMDIPVDDSYQFQGNNPKVSSLSPRQQLEAIRNQVETTGKYRIPHYPYVEGLDAANFDSKTAGRSGPSQLAFDQMSGQNMCRISNDLKKHPDYNKFKYYMAGVARGCSINPDQWIPESRQKSIVDYFNADRRNRFPNLNRAGRAPSEAMADTEAVIRNLYADTERNHEQANGFKEDRHQRFLNKYLTSVENQSTASAAEEARYFATEMEAPTYMSEEFHAIQDYGGVKGVPESETDDLSNLRAVLEPMGVRVDHWSMMRGADPEYNSLAFSDQFPLLYEQDAIRDVYKELEAANPGQYVDMCKELKNRSIAALAIGEPEGDNGPLANAFDIESWCRDYIASEDADGGAFSDNLKGVMSPIRVMMEPNSKELFQSCFMCHGKDGFLPENYHFPGMNKMGQGDQWSEEAWREFSEYMTQPRSNNRPPMGEAMIRKLAAGQMPPNGWNRNPTEAEQSMGIRNDDDRRRSLIGYIQLSFATGNNKEATLRMCRGLVSGSGAETDAAGSNSGSGSGVQQQ